MELSVGLSGKCRKLFSKARVCRVLLREALILESQLKTILYLET